MIKLDKKNLWYKMQTLDLTKCKPLEELSEKQSIFFEKRSQLIIPLLYKVSYYLFLPITIIYLTSLMALNMMPQKYVSPSSITIASSDFIQKIVILGIISVIMTFFINIFNRKTKIHHAIALGNAIFIFLYIFHLFDGFNPSGSLGNYKVEGSQIYAIVGLQIITMLLLGFAVFKGIYHVVKIFELRKEKGFFRKDLKTVFARNTIVKVKNRQGKKRKVRFSLFMKSISLILVICLGMYVSTLIGSGFNVKLEVPETYSFSWGSEDIDHDGLCVSVDFDMPNMGMYSVSDIYVTAEVFTASSSNESRLPRGVKVAGVENFHVRDFNAFTPTDPKAVTVAIYNDNLLGLFLCDSILEIKLYSTSKYGGIDIDLNAVIEWEWMNILESIDAFAMLGDYGIEVYVKIIETIGITNLLNHVSLAYLLTTLGEDGIGLIIGIIGLPAFLVLFGLNTIWDLLAIIDVSNLLIQRGLFSS